MKNTSRTCIAASLLAVVCAVGATTASAQDPFLGEIRTFGSNFCPRGWASTEGQLLPISMNSALFALLGTLFGGDGRTTFALPNLRGRVVIGTAPSMYSVGAQGGSETHTLTIDEMPSHAHGVPGLSVSPAVMVKEAKNDNNAVTVQSTTPGATESTQSTGGGQAHNNMQPYLAMTTCIAVEGIFPSRN